jgi:hypothetical protein
MARDTKTNLNFMCHGNPFIKTYDRSEVKRCPCENCLVKPTCKDPCGDFDLYSELVKGHISVKYYNDMIKNGRRCE